MKFLFAILLGIFASVTKAENSDLVFDFYYESLCPFCIKYIKQAWEVAVNTDGLLELFTLNFWPYGNASEHKGDQYWEFKCQHGVAECYGNQLEVCILNQRQTSEKEKLNGIMCLETQGAQSEDAFNQALKTCESKGNYNATNVLSCSNSTYGNYLQHEVAVKTSNLSPPHKWVPWLVVNGVYDEDVQDQVEGNVVQYICQNSNQTLASSVSACSQYLNTQQQNTEDVFLKNLYESGNIRKFNIDN